MTVRIPTTLLALCAAALPASSRAQVENQPELWRAVVQVIRGDLPHGGPILLDPRVDQRTLKGPTGTTRDHAPATLAVLEGALGGRVAKVEEVISCAPNDPSSCHFVQGVGFVAFGEPRLQGDTASVLVFSAVPTPAPEMPIAQQELLVVLVRRGQVWQVVEKRILRVS